MVEQDTEKYIYEHKKRIRKWLISFAAELIARSESHDNSKLMEPELSGWKQMDQEPRYKYGIKDYFKKLKKYKWLLELHWSNNKHHPEYWEMHPDDKSRDLVDILEMLADWSSYKDKMSYTEASEMVEKQSERYHLSDELKDLLLNTLSNYFVYFGGTSPSNNEPTSGHTDILI